MPSAREFRRLALGRTTPLKAPTWASAPGQPAIRAPQVHALRNAVSQRRAVGRPPGPAGGADLRPRVPGRALRRGCLPRARAFARRPVQAAAGLDRRRRDRLQARVLRRLLDAATLPRPASSRAGIGHRQLYLWRHFIPPLTGAGFRVIVPDHLGFGRSDKPDDPALYRIPRHAARTEQLLESLNLREATVVPPGRLEPASSCSRERSRPGPTARSAVSSPASTAASWHFVRSRSSSRGR